jgi:hypothetical protein
LKDERQPPALPDFISGQNRAASIGQCGADIETVNMPRQADNSRDEKGCFMVSGWQEVSVCA